MSPINEILANGMIDEYSDISIYNIGCELDEFILLCEDYLHSLEAFAELDLKSVDDETLLTVWREFSHGDEPSTQNIRDHFERSQKLVQEFVSENTAEYFYQRYL